MIQPLINILSRIELDAKNNSLKVNGIPVSSTNPLPVSSGTGGATADRELVVTTYYVKTAFTGASLNDTITCTQVLDVTTTPTVVGVIWRNQTTALDLASTPSSTNLTLAGSTELTAQPVIPSHVELLSSTSLAITANTYKSISLIVMSGSINIDVDGVLINNFPTNYTETWGNGVGFISKPITITTNTSTRVIINLTK
jgi:hypothetical protein